ncbi:hypothetical protein KAH37_07315 [bacterium]|nr:hypothetical protein [bacterium]
MSKLLVRETVQYDIAPLIDAMKIEECQAEFYVDARNREEIEEILLKHKKKFRRILYEICMGRYGKDLYGKENVSERAAQVTAMKFKGKENVRIACKEFFRGGKKVVMIAKIIKKSQKNKKLVKQIYEKIGGYEYEFKK